MSNKLTLNKMKSIIEPTHEPTIVTYYTDNNEEIKIEFDTNLSQNEMSRFIDTVVDGVFTDLDEYVPEYRDVMTFIALIKISNMPLPKKKSNGIDIIDIATAYEWMQKLNLINDLRNHKDEFGSLLTLFNYLEVMITEKIEFKKQELISTLKADLQKTYNEIENMAYVISEFGNKFKDFNLDELSEVAKSLASKDEKEIANAVIDIRSYQKDADIDSEIEE